MARGHGRILTCIWEDQDFLALDPQQQRLYMFLVSQPNLNHAGLLPLTLRRWARKARGLTVADVEKTLADLEQRRFVVIDEDAEEILIRTFVRNDGVFRMPKVMAAMVSGAGEITSPKLRRALLAEMDRLPLDELSDEPGARGPSVRQQVVEHVTKLRRLLRAPDPEPPNTPKATHADTPVEGFAKGIDSPSDTPSDTEAEPTTRGRAATRDARSPAPAPAPAPAPTPEREPAQAPAVTPPANRPDGRNSLHTLPDDFALTNGMRVWAQQTFPRVDVDHETQKFIWHWRDEGRRKRNWYGAWQKWIADANEHLRRHGTASPLASNVIALPSGQTLTGTDATVAGWAALATPPAPSTEDSA